MNTIRQGNIVKVSYDGEDEAFTATVCRLLTDQEEGLSSEVDAYVAGWLELSQSDCSAESPRMTIMLGTDGQHYLNGRSVSVKVQE